jgi:hypothetical protein
MSHNLQSKLDFWIKNNLNVLLVGDHGVGKSAHIISAFNRANLRWKYFSGSTMDVWTDLVGTPKEVKDESGSSYLGFIRPKEFEDDAVDAIFIDEFNRSAPKVRNACMELIQFKSINGRKFNNLKFVWAAINPYDEESTYDVDRLDPAQQDRFQVLYTLPNDPDEDYFTATFGSIGQKAVKWWNYIPEEHQPLVSPRRLQYAIEYYNIGGDLTDVLPAIVKPKSLKNAIETMDRDLTHDQKWQQDPELYLNQICSRTDDTDVVAAFQSLMGLSMDKAASYCEKLPANKLKLLANNEKTILILIKAPKMSKSIVTALNSVGYSDERRNQLLTEAITNCHDNPNLLEVVAQTDKDKTNIESWQHLMVLLQNGVNKYEARLILFACILRLGKNKPDTWNSSKLGICVLRAAKYIVEYYAAQDSTLLYFAPVVIAAIVSA